MGKLVDETDLMNLLCALYDARHDLSYAIKKVPELLPVEAIPKAEYEARLTELRSMTLRVKHNTGSIDTLIDKLDDLLSEVQE